MPRILQNRYVLAVTTCASADDIHPSKFGCHNYFAYLLVDDVDEFYSEFKSRGGKTLGNIADNL